MADAFIFTFITATKLLMKAMNQVYYHKSFKHKYLILFVFKKYRFH